MEEEIGEQVMPSKSPELKAIEKQIKEEKKHAQEDARYVRAKAVVDAAKYIHSFRVMNSEAEIMLKVALDKLEDPSKYVVSVDKKSFDKNISDNFALVCEELQQYGVITAYMLFGTCAQLTLSEAGKTYFKNKEEAKTEESNMLKSGRDQVFISHRTVDAPVADMIKDFLVNTGIPNDKVFCSSLPGNDVNEKIAPEVKQRLQKSIVNILILSKDYYESAYCLNEAGIVWYLDEAIAVPIGLPEIDHTHMIGFLNSDYKLRRLDNDDDISYLYDISQEKLQTNTVKHSVITRETTKLKERYAKYIANRDVCNSTKGQELQGSMSIATIEKDEGVLLVYAAESDGQIIVTENISRFGPYVEAGGFDFTASDTPRECARWKAAVEKLDRCGLVENPKYDGTVYKVTDKGYKIADQVKARWEVDISKTPTEYV